MAKKKTPLTKCGNCKHGGDHFRLGRKTHLHCQHPDEKVAGDPGWGTLREWFGSCDQWAAKAAIQGSTERALNGG